MTYGTFHFTFPDFKYWVAVTDLCNHSYQVLYSAVVLYSETQISLSKHTNGNVSVISVQLNSMAKVQVMNVVVLDNPSAFLNPFQFEITFECLEDLQEDLEWRIIYVGSAESEAFDQVLDTVYVGPVPQGRHMFVFQADPPDPAKIPVADVVGVTVVLLTCSYRYIILCKIYYSSEVLLQQLKAFISVDVSKKR